MTQNAFKDLDKIIETATSLSLIEVLGLDDEKIRQKQLEDDLDDLKSGGKKSKKDEVEEGEESPAAEESPPPKGEETPTPATPSVEEVTDATVDDIVDKLNMLRSGKSTKDEEVRDQLAAYWDGMQHVLVELSSLVRYIFSLCIMNH